MLREVCLETPRDGMETHKIVRRFNLLRGPKMMEQIPFLLFPITYQSSRARISTSLVTGSRRYGTTKRY